MWEKLPPGTSSFAIKYVATSPPEGHTNHTATPESIDKETAVIVMQVT
jgi:hypothetical protein